ncbi:MAG: hypothetical protein WC861_05150 [Candidatus Micrarchaeia archaeon]|jgi:hypothetical protein
MAKATQAVQNNDIISNIVQKAKDEKAPVCGWHHRIYIWGGKDGKYADAQSRLERYAELFMNSQQMARDIKKERADMPITRNSRKENAPKIKELKERLEELANNPNNLTSGIHALESLIKIGGASPDAYLLLGAAYAVSNNLPKAHAISAKLREMGEPGREQLLASMVYYGAYIVMNSSHTSDTWDRLNVFHKGRDSEEMARAIMNGTPLPKAFIDLQNVCKFKTRMFD